MKREHHGAVRHLKNLLPVPRFDYSADELFACDGTETLAMEIMTTYIRAPETRVDVDEEIDIMCPSWIADYFIGQVLPHALPEGVFNAFVDTPVKACHAWFEDMDVRDSLIVVREIEAYMKDLPDVWRFNESLHQDILQTYCSVAKEFGSLELESSTKLQVHYAMEPGPYDIPLVLDRGCQNGNSVLQTLLDDADPNLETAKSVHQNSVKVLELKVLDEDLLLEQHSAQSRHRELEEYTKTIDIQNLVARVGGSEVEETVSELLDFDPEDFLLDKFHIRGNTVQHKLQSASSALRAFGGLSLLNDDSVAAETSIITNHAAMNHTTRALFDLPEVLEDGYLDSILTLDLGTYVSTLMKPNPVELEVFDSQEIAFQDFEKLVVLPELTLETSRFHFLQVPSFISEQQTRIPEYVFKVLFRAKGQPSSTSTSDWLYLDWHLSQDIHCNNYGCFHLQRGVVENELHLQVPRDSISGNQMPDNLLLLSLADDSLPWQSAECGNREVCPAADRHASAPTPVYDLSNIVCTAAEAADKILSDQSVLTHDPRNNSSSARDQVPLAGSDPIALINILSPLKRASEGDLSRGAESIQVSESEFYHEQGYQAVANTKNKSLDQSPKEYHVFESASTPMRIPTPNPLSSSDIDSTSSFNLQSSNPAEPELQVPPYTPGCPSKELPQSGIKPAPTLQPADEKLRLQQLEVDDLTLLSSGQGQEPHLIIVANILQSCGSIILQRRSSYQKILGLESEDLQVVERELKLPVDLILNPSTCLTVYTEDKLLRCAKSHYRSSEDFFSCIMDMIADCHMKALSSSFQRWFMIFEGKLAFNSAINHILHKLYICASGFQMRVQGFISANPADTDTLVLRCIKKMWKMSKGPFDSPMPEVPTHGEVFLETFPSINPLSAHAILCLNIPIATFISWSHEEKICALQDVSVPTETLNLLTAQVLYGKLAASFHRGIFSECPWPTASEIVAPEVGRHVQATYFLPTSVTTGCEFKEDPGLPPREGHSDPYAPICPNPIVPYDSAEQGTSTYNGVCWPDDDESATFARHAYDCTQQPDCVEENYGCKNPTDVHGILQQWIRSRKGADKDMNHSETESELYCDSFKVPNYEPHRERPCMNRSPTSVECPTNAVYPTYRHEANNKLRWASFLKISGKRPISILEQFCRQRGVSLALQPHKKKLKQAVQSDLSQYIGPSPQLDMLKISKESW